MNAPGDGLRLYDELADWFHLLTAPEEYAGEAAFILDLLRARVAAPLETLLELGSGGGNTASHLRAHLRLTLTDISGAMLDLSRTLNPGCEHELADMRTVRLGRTFDAVLIHDAVMYMTTRGRPAGRPGDGVRPPATRRRGRDRARPRPRDVRAVHAATAAMTGPAGLSAISSGRTTRTPTTPPSSPTSRSCCARAPMGCGCATTATSRDCSRGRPGSTCSGTWGSSRHGSSIPGSATSSSACAHRGRSHVRARPERQRSAPSSVRRAARPREIQLATVPSGTSNIAPISRWV